MQRLATVLALLHLRAQTIFGDRQQHVSLLRVGGDCTLTCRRPFPSHASETCAGFGCLGGRRDPRMHVGRVVADKLLLPVDHHLRRVHLGVQRAWRSRSAVR